MLFVISQLGFHLLICGLTSGYGLHSVGGPLAATLESAAEHRSDWNVSDANTKRGATARRQHLWTSGLVPVHMHGDLGKIKSLRLAMGEIEANSCVRFVEWNEQKDYIDFIFSENRRIRIAARTVFMLSLVSGMSCAGDGEHLEPSLDGRCSSAVGRQVGRQLVHLGPRCFTRRLILHELMHVLGFWHEHNRPDRDRYVVIHKQNVIKGKENEFNRYDLKTIHSMNQPYDYDSVMQYGVNEFAQRPWLETISPLKESVEFGHGQHLSTGDIVQLNMLYDCSQAAAVP